MEKKKWEKPELKVLKVAMTAGDDWWELGLLIPLFGDHGHNGPRRCCS